MSHPAKSVFLFFFLFLRYLESIISFAVPNRKTRIIDYNYVVGRRRLLNGTRERSSVNMLYIGNIFLKTFIQCIGLGHELSSKISR